MKKVVKAVVIAAAMFSGLVNAKSCNEIITSAYNHTIQDYNGDPSVVKSLDALTLYMQTCEQAKDMKAKGVDHDYWYNKIKGVNEKYVLKGLLPTDVYYTNMIVAKYAYE